MNVQYSESIHYIRPASPGHLLEEKGKKWLHSFLPKVTGWPKLVVLSVTLLGNPNSRHTSSILPGNKSRDLHTSFLQAYLLSQQYVVIFGALARMAQGFQRCFSNNKHYTWNLCTTAVRFHNKLGFIWTMDCLPEESAWQEKLDLQYWERVIWTRWLQ